MEAKVLEGVSIELSWQTKTCSKLGIKAISKAMNYEAMVQSSK